jgi:hypothetical protein
MAVGVKLSVLLGVDVDGGPDLILFRDANSVSLQRDRAVSVNSEVLGKTHTEDKATALCGGINDLG